MDQGALKQLEGCTLAPLLLPGSSGPPLHPLELPPASLSLGVPFFSAALRSTSELLPALPAYAGHLEQALHELGLRQEGKQSFVWQFLICHDSLEFQ